MKSTKFKSRRFYTKVRWNWLLLTTLLFLFFMSSCSKDDVNADDKLGEFNTKTIQIDGLERTYHVYLPNNFNETNTTPMVLALHGGGGTGKRFERDVSAGTLTEAAEERGMILVMPDGIDKRWNDGRTEHFGNDSMYDDIGFISALIDKMIQDYGVDSDRIFATGISNGGIMSIRLGLDLSNKIAAIAPVTASMAKVVESKVPNFPISMLLINGTADPLVPYSGGCIDT